MECAAKNKCGTRNGYQNARRARRRRMIETGLSAEEVDVFVCQRCKDAHAEYIRETELPPHEQDPWPVSTYEPLEEPNTKLRPKIVAKNAGWMARALCVDTDTALFFHPNVTGQIKAMCQTCPVVVECADAAVRNREPFGFFGGTTIVDRMFLRGEPLPKGAKAPGPHVPIEVLEHFGQSR